MSYKSDPSSSSCTVNAGKGMDAKSGVFTAPVEVNYKLINYKYIIKIFKFFKFY